MRKILFFFYMLVSFSAIAQVDSSSSKLMNEMDTKDADAGGKKPVKVFYSQRLINANTVEMLPKGFLEFKVIHNFGDMGGKNGGFSTAFGVDGATDIKIAFLFGLTKKLNMIVSRTKGSNLVIQLWEMGFKYQFLQQWENDRSHPLSLALFVNGVVSTQQADTNKNRLLMKEFSYQKTSDRMSQLVQLMIARKFGKVLSLQLSPTYLHTNFVIHEDVNNIFALGTAVRVPIYKRFSLIADYFHSFRPNRTVRGVYLYDAFGVGVEILTPGHIFHMNFTNCTNALENRFIPRTNTSWGKGQYRWGFTIARNFVLFKDKKKI